MAIHEVWQVVHAYNFGLRAAAGAVDRKAAIAIAVLFVVIIVGEVAFTGRDMDPAASIRSSIELPVVGATTPAVSGVQNLDC